MTASPRVQLQAERPVAVLGAAFLTQMAGAYGFMTFGFLAPSLAAETGLNERDFSLSFSFIFLATAFSSPFTGRLMHRLGGAWTTALTLLGMGGAVLLALLGSWWSVMLASFCFGLFYGPFSPANMTIVTRRSPPRRRGLFLSLRHTSVPVAGVVAGRVLPPLMLALGWQTGVLSVSGTLIAAALFALLAAPALRLPADAPGMRRAEPAVAAGLLGALRARFGVPPELRLLWGAALCFAVTQIALTTMSYFYVLETLHLSPIAAGIFASNIQLAAVVGRPALGWLTDRIGAPQLVLGAIALLSSLATLLLLAVPAGAPAATLVALALVCGLAGQTWNPIFVTAMSFRVAPERQAEMNGRAFAIASLGWMAAAPLFWGLIELSGGYAAPFLLVAVANAALAALLVARSRVWRRR